MTGPKIVKALDLNLFSASREALGKEEKSKTETQEASAKAICADLRSAVAASDGGKWSVNGLCTTLSDSLVADKANPLSVSLDVIRQRAALGAMLDGVSAGLLAKPVVNLFNKQGRNVTLRETLGIFAQNGTGTLTREGQPIKGLKITGLVEGYLSAGSVKEARAFVAAQIGDALTQLPAVDPSEPNKPSGPKPTVKDAVLSAMNEAQVIRAALAWCRAQKNPELALDGLRAGLETAVDTLASEAADAAAKAASKPAASKPAASKPAASKPAASKPAASKAPSKPRKPRAAATVAAGVAPAESLF